MEKSSFFTSLNGDRKYKSEDFAKFFGTLVGNGVFPNPATGLQVVSMNNDMSVTLLPGKGWISGYLYENTANLNITLGYPDGTLSRVDTIVLRWDLANREMRVYAKKGEFAEVPTAPEVTRSSDIHELALAHIRVGKNVMKIEQSDISDLRLNPSYCGIVTGMVDQIDTTELFNQVQAVITNSNNDIATWLEEVKVFYAGEFNSWFDQLRGTINDDVAGSLLNQIIENKNSILGIQNQLNNLSSSADKITLLDTAGNFTSPDVEGALAELAVEVKGSGVVLQEGLNGLLGVLEGGN